MSAAILFAAVTTGVGFLGAVVIAAATVIGDAFRQRVWDKHIDAALAVIR